MLRFILIVMIYSLTNLSFAVQENGDELTYVARMDTEEMEGFGFQRYFTTDKFGRDITFYLSRCKSSLAERSLPLVVCIQGSGSQSIFQKVETPDGAQTGEMTIEKSEGVYEVTIESKVYGTLELAKVKLDKANIVGELELEGNSLEFDMDYDGDSMEGTIYMGESELSLSAERQKK